MINPAVSVIIPVYNAERYIGECLDSLVKQTFRDFEVIVVDDRSTDGSCEIVKNFGDKFKVLTLSKNSGCPSLPRNFALTEARGKYVYFLDSDDLLSTTALEELYKVAEKFVADVVHSEKCLVFLDKCGINSAEPDSFQTDEFVTEPTLETLDIGKRVIGFTQKRFMWQVWGKLFRRQFLSDNKIKFPAISIFEDYVFVFECLVAAKNYVRVPFVSYYYRVHDDSMSHKAISIPEFMEILVKVVKSTDDFMNGRKFFIDNPKYKYVFADFFLQERLDTFSKNFISGNYTIDDIYNFLYKKIFSHRPQDNIALTTYLFVAANILILHTKQQATELDELKRQLAVLRNNLEVSS